MDVAITARGHDALLSADLCGTHNQEKMTCVGTSLYLGKGNRWIIISHDMCFYVSVILAFQNELTEIIVSKLY